MLRVVLDCREYDSLRPEAPRVYGASEPLICRLAASLAHAGHLVDAIYKGDKELFVDGVRWWPYERHPKTCDVLISCEWLILEKEFEYERLYVPLNKINPILSQKEDKVNAFVVFSEEHKRQLLFINPTIKEEQVVLIPPGVEIPETLGPKIRNRLLWSNTPERGLVHLARAWPALLKRVPDATIAITYGVERSWNSNKWLMDNIAEELVEVRRWVRNYPLSVLDMGRVKKTELLAAQVAAELYPYPADAPLPGIVHAFVVMEAAAAGCGLLLSRLEGLPEVFKDCAEFLDIPVNPSEWAEVMADILLDDRRKKAMGERAREWALRRPWSAWAEKWNSLVEGGVWSKQPSPV